MDLTLWFVLGAQKIPPNLPFSKGGAHAKQHAEAPPFAKKGGVGGIQKHVMNFGMSEQKINAPSMMMPSITKTTTATKSKRPRTWRIGVILPTS